MGVKGDVYVLGRDIPRFTPDGIDKVPAGTRIIHQGNYLEGPGCLLGANHLEDMLADGRLIPAE